MGVAGCVAVYERAESNLVGNASAGEPLGNDPDHNPEHGCAAIEAFSPLQLIHMDVASCSCLKPVVVGLRRFHRQSSRVTKLKHSKKELDEIEEKRRIREQAEAKAKKELMDYQNSLLKKEAQKEAELEASIRLPYAD